MDCGGNRRESKHDPKSGRARYHPQSPEMTGVPPATTGILTH